MAATLMSYRTDEGTRAALVGDPGRKYIPVLMMDGGTLSVQKVPNDQQRYMRPYKELRKKHVKVFRSYGRAFGISNAAREFLNEIEATL